MATLVYVIIIRLTMAILIEKIIREREKYKFHNDNDNNNYENVHYI